MKISSEADIANLIKSDTNMMEVLGAAQELDLPDWWIGAGFLRNKIWDAIEDNPDHPNRDIDLVYFNPNDLSAETDWNYDMTMAEKLPSATWEIRNQARMNYVNDFPAFTSTADGISHWVETATCVAVKLVGDDLKFLFCYGKEDLLKLVARPTPYFVRSEDLLKKFYQRVEEKRWQERWPHLQVIAE